MLGEYVQYLCSRAGLSQGNLAAKANLAESELAALERQPARRLPGSDLLALSEAFQLKKAGEFAHLLQLNGAARRFRAFVVGLPKSGTASLCGIFSAYRTAHEFWQWDTNLKWIDYRQGKIDRLTMRDYLRLRANAACIELDSAYFNTQFIDILAEMFPEACFIALIRDPFSWVNAYSNYYTQPECMAMDSQAMANGFPFDLPYGENDAKSELREHFEQYARGIIRHWADSIHSMLSMLPAGRSLVIPTHEISFRLKEMAQLTGVPLESLREEHSHLNHSINRVNLYHGCDRKHLQAEFDRHCAGLVAEYFPEFSLECFMEVAN